MCLGIGKYLQPYFSESCVGTRLSTVFCTGTSSNRFFGLLEVVIAPQCGSPDFAASPYTRALFLIFKISKKTDTLCASHSPAQPHPSHSPATSKPYALNVTISKHRLLAIHETSTAAGQWRSHSPWHTTTSLPRIA